MKKILIAIDYDSAAKNIARTGFDVARSMNAETILLHVVIENTYYPSTRFSPIMGFDNLSGLDTIETENISQLEKIAEEFLEQTKNYLGDDTIQTIVQTGDYSDTIVSMAKELNVDMIVMGTHNRKGIEKMVSGSIAEKVLHNSSIPALIIPPKPL